MDARLVEKMLKLLIEGIDTISNALQLILMHYQNLVEEELAANFERSEGNE